MASIKGISSRVSVRVFLIALAIVVVCAVFRSSSVSAGGLSLTPAFQTIELLSDQGNVEYSVSIENKETYAVTYRLSVIDMGTLDETGGVIFSGLSADYQQKYGAAKWVQLSQETVTIAAESTLVVPYTVMNNSQLGPGGHYGAVIIQPDEQVNNVENEVVLSPRAASLLFIRKRGGEVLSQTIQAPPDKSFWGKAPRSISLKMINEGNVHFVPRGVVSLTKGDKLISRGVINQESSLVLPEKTRWYTVNLQSMSRWQLPGRYSLNISYRYDGKEDFSYSQVTYTIYNLPLVLLTFAAAGATAAAYIILRRRFKNQWQKIAALRRTLIERLPGGSKLLKRVDSIKDKIFPKKLAAQKRPFVFWPTRDSARKPRSTRFGKK